MNATAENVLAEFGPELRERQQTRHTAERKRLRQQLANQASNLIQIRKLEADLATADAEVANRRAEVEIAKEEYRKVSAALSDVRRKEADERAATWRELEAIPSPELVAFRRDVEQRLESTGNLSSSWPSRHRDQGIGCYLLEGNRDSVNAYAQALIATRDEITAAVRLGLEGTDAEAAIAAMRAKWPKVQFGVKEWRVP